MASTSGPAHRVTSAVEQYGFPKGHLGHLTDTELASLKEFKERVVKEGLWNPKDNDDLYGTRDDATLLRFLRARRFIVADAFAQFKDTEKWRNATQLDTLYETIDLEHYDETRKLYPQWTGRRDRRGIPLYVFEVKHLNSKTMAAYEKSAVKTETKAKGDGKTPQKLLRLFALYENLVRFVIPLSTALPDRDHPRTPITQSNNIVDISGVGLKQFWNLRTHMQDASTLATAHYPETLDRIFIIGAPSFFPTVWGWIKRWFDPITTSKIFILSNHEMKQTLESFIDPANIPKKYGGQLDFEFGGTPILDPAMKDVLEWKDSYKDFPHGPLYWRDQGDHIELIAVGSVDKKERSGVVATVKKTVKLHTLEDNLESNATHRATLDSSKIAGAGALATTTEGSVATSNHNETDPNVTEPKAVDAGVVVPASRPEPVSFVTAKTGLNELSIKNQDKLSSDVSGGPHSTETANRLDPKVDNSGLPKQVDLEESAVATETSKPSSQVDKSLSEKIKDTLHI